MDEQFLQGQTEQVRDVQGELQRRRASAILDGADGLPADTKHVYEVALPYLLLPSDLS